MALGTVSDMIRQARVLLQDTVEEYRYSDQTLMDNINRGLLEARRLRPELMRSYFSTGTPEVTATTDDVPIDEQYRVALLYYVVGQAQLEDDENTQDARATVFIQKFLAQMLTINS